MRANRAGSANPANLAEYPHLRRLIRGGGLHATGLGTARDQQEIETLLPTWREWANLWSVVASELTEEELFAWPNNPKSIAKRQPVVLVAENEDWLKQTYTDELNRRQVLLALREHALSAMGVR